MSPEQFEALSKSMESDEPIKALITKNLNLMIEAEFEVKIGAQKSEQTPERPQTYLNDSTRNFVGEVRQSVFSRISTHA